MGIESESNTWGWRRVSPETKKKKVEFTGEMRQKLNWGPQLGLLRAKDDENGTRPHVSAFKESYHALPSPKA